MNNLRENNEQCQDVQMEELPARRQVLTDVQTDRANEEKRKFFPVALRITADNCSALRT